MHLTCYENVSLFSGSTIFQFNLWILHDKTFQVTGHFLLSPQYLLVVITVYNWEVPPVMVTRAVFYPYQSGCKLKPISVIQPRLISVTCKYFKVSLAPYDVTFAPIGWGNYFGFAFFKSPLVPLTLVLTDIVSMISQPFNSQKLLTWNFSLQYPFINQQIGNENIQTYQVEAAILI